jgi:hypothetical protein
MQRKEEGVEVREGAVWEQKIGRQDRRETSDLKAKRNLALTDKKKVLDIILIYVKKCLNGVQSKMYSTVSPRADLRNINS